MRAVAVEKFKGEPRLMDLPKPEPKEDQLLVKVGAAGLNPFDWKLVDGVLDGVMPHVFPLILGNDAAGVVAGLGAKVSRFRQGDRVFGQFLHAPIGEGTDAEFAVVPESGTVTKIPDGVSDETAAALPTAGMTALAMVESLDLPGGSKVLIVGATGGVGLFTTQIAAAKGFKVLGTASPKDSDRLRSLGATETFDYHQGDLVAQVLRAHPNGVNALIDLASDAAAFTKMTGLVSKRGYALTTVGAANPADLKERGIQGGNFYLQANAALLDRLAALVASKKLVVTIESVVTLESAPAAIAANRRGGARGKTVIRIG
jgi:NADPH:quinone reductase